MNSKIGRNDPCPCGSGKKYKQCCLAQAQQTAVEEKPHAGAIDRAVSWLMSRHRQAALQAIHEMLYDGLTEDEQDKLDSLVGEAGASIQLNATEWLISEGSIQIKSEYLRVKDVLLGFGGPLFTVGQRQWIEQLSKQPLRLYDVTDVLPGQQMTLCDALDVDAPPIVVWEKSGSTPELVGTKLGARLMQVGDHFEMSGCAYPFSMLAGMATLDILIETERKLKELPDDLAEFYSYVIRRKWLDQYISPPVMPGLMDARTGQSMLLITDHYRVKDWDALDAALSTKRDVDGDRTNGWTRVEKCDDGLTRPRSTINIAQGKDEIELFHKTQLEADKGRKWFDKLAADSVEFVGRTLTDPLAMLSAEPDSPSSNPKGNLPDMPPEVMADVIEKTMRRMYANWADEPIPALGGKTPRDAMKTATGAERVRGLIRSYEASERAQAAEQGRRVISFEFLWRELGLSTE